MANYRNSRFVALKDVLEDMIKEMRISGKMNEMNVRKHWHELMGALYHEPYLKNILQTRPVICLFGVFRVKARIIYGANKNCSFFK